jgi:hypothetical protein
MPNVTTEQCSTNRNTIFKKVDSRLPRWVFFAACGVVASALTAIGGYALANANGITVLKVEMAHVREDLKEMDEVQKEQMALLRKIEKRVNGG